MRRSGGRGRFGIARAAVAIAAALLLVASGLAVYYLASSPGGTTSGSATGSATSSGCADSGSSPCSGMASNTTSATLAGGALILSGVRVVSLCYVSNCGSLPIAEVTFYLTNLSRTNGTIISLNITCDGCGIGGGLNHEAYSLVALLGGYSNQSAYRCEIGTPEFDNVPPGNTSFDVLCYGPGSALVVNPYYYRIAVCAAGDVSPEGACSQAPADLAVAVNAAPYGSHLQPAHRHDAGSAEPAGAVTEGARHPPGRLDGLPIPSSWSS